VHMCAYYLHEPCVVCMCVCRVHVCVSCAPQARGGGEHLNLIYTQTDSVRWGGESGESGETGESIET